MTGIARQRTIGYSIPSPREGYVPQRHSPGGALERVRVEGLHLATGDQPFRVRGVTYGSFLPRQDGVPFPAPQVCRADFQAMAAAGLNVVRVYSQPPRELLDAAGEAGLRLLVGVHYDDWRMLPPAGRRGQRRVRDAGRRAVEETMRLCAGRPEVLAVAVGNEVPADLVRWYGVRSVEEVLAELVEQVHAADPGMPATYVNYPTTEFLDVAGQDLACFNVFLERPADWRAYLRHLQVVVGERPLVVAECGLAAEVHGEAKQAAALEWQLRAADELGVGVSVFSWTDEWGVNGQPVTGWGFGVTGGGEDRRPKPAVEVMRQWARRPLRELRPSWPRMSVVVCAYNEEARIASCLDSLGRCDYPDLEVIVCDDGSSDRTLEIARGYPYQVLALPRGGLSRARNAGLRAARGEIIAYLDGDAQCHPDWPYHLALALDEPGVVAAGGPNLPVPDAGFAERVVEACPGGPVHVLLTDDRAEHIPGCNMAIRRDALIAVEGFDEVFTSAGDDVDLCWKLQDRGGLVAFAPAAQVRHHRRATFRGYLRQQFNYGRSERMVAGRHPHRFNRLGQARWRGFIYGGQRILPSLLRPVIYHGIAGEAPFQPTRRRTSETALAWMSALVPVLVLPVLVGLAILPWSLWGLGLVAVVLVCLAAHAGLVAIAASPSRGEPRPIGYRFMVGFLHVAQPLVRAWGRVRGPRVTAANGNGKSEWRGDRAAWIHSLQRDLAHRRYRVRLGDTSDEWDLEVSRGPLVAARMRVAVAWSWIPAYRVRWRVRTPALLALASVAALGVFRPALGLAAGAVIVAVIAAAAWRVRREVGRAVEATTEGLAGRA